MSKRFTLVCILSLGIQAFLMTSATYAQSDFSEAEKVQKISRCAEVFLSAMPIPDKVSLKIVTRLHNRFLKATDSSDIAGISSSKFHYVVIRADATKRQDVLLKGLLNFHQTGETFARKDVQLRNESEAYLSAIPVVHYEQLSNDIKPKHGFLITDSTTEIPQLPNAYMTDTYVLKTSRIGSRATATFGDSLVMYETIKAIAAGDDPLRDQIFIKGMISSELQSRGQTLPSVWTIPATRSQFIPLTDFLGIPGKSIFDELLGFGNKYQEAQVWGRIGIDDIYALVLDSIYEQAPYPGVPGQKRLTDEFVHSYAARGIRLFVRDQGQRGTDVEAIWPKIKLLMSGGMDYNLAVQRAYRENAFPAIPIYPE